MTNVVAHKAQIEISPLVAELDGIIANNYFKGINPWLQSVAEALPFDSEIEDQIYLRLREKLPTLEDKVFDFIERAIKNYRPTWRKWRADEVREERRLKWDLKIVAQKEGLLGLAARLAAAKPKFEEEKSKLQGLSDRLEALKPNEEKIGLPAIIPPQEVDVFPEAEAQDIPSEGPDAIRVLNKYHALIENRAKIATIEPSRLHPGCFDISYMTQDAFKLCYSNRKVRYQVQDDNGDWRQVTKKLGAYWLDHKKRQQYRGVVFVPNGDRVVDRSFNLWRKWGVNAIKGDWSLIRWHIENVICRGNAECAEYVIKWIAWAIQNPDLQGEVALVLIGEKGSGKGTLAFVLEMIFRPHARRVYGADGMTGRFNVHLEDCILLVADEALWGGNKKAVGQLQALITEDTIRVEPKGIDSYEAPNYLHHLWLAEPGWVIPAGRHERRYAVIQVSQEKLGDRKYFERLRNRTETGGAEAMFYDLRTMDLRGWHPRDIPESILRSSIMQNQQRQTFEPLEQWYLSLLHEGSLPGQIVVRSKPTGCRSSDLMEHAKSRVSQLRFNFNSNNLRDFLIDAGRIGVKWDKMETNRCNGWIAPPLADCRKAFERLYGKIDWDTQSGEWRRYSADLKDWIMVG